MAEAMKASDPTKEMLKHYLQVQREALWWKLDGLSERDARYPRTETGTNMLGIVKHAVTVEAGYLGAVFGRPLPEETPWLAQESEPNADMWATPGQTIEWMRGFADRVWAHSNRTIAKLDLDAPGRVPWWGDGGDVTLERILVHVSIEYARHTGHADILRELIDGEVGLRQGADNMPDRDAQWWQAYVAGLKMAAESFTNGDVNA